jgi:hypothetical protein
MRPDQDMVPDLDGVPARAADVKVFPDDALGTDPHRRTMASMTAPNATCVRGLIVTFPQITAVEAT